MLKKVNKDLRRGKSLKDMNEKVIMQDVTTTEIMTFTNLSTPETTEGRGSPPKTDQKDVPTRAPIETDPPPTVALKNTLPELNPNLRQKTNHQTFQLPKNLKIKNVEQKKSMARLNKAKLLLMKVRILKVNSDGRTDHTRIVNLTETNTHQEKDLDHDQALPTKTDCTLNRPGKRRSRWKFSEISESSNNESQEISRMAAESLEILKIAAESLEILKMATESLEILRMVAESLGIWEETSRKGIGVKLKKGTIMLGKNCRLGSKMKGT